MITKRCPGMETREGMLNPNCQGEFKVLACHQSRKVYCDSCQKLKNNAYHRRYLKKWRADNKKV